MALLARQNIPDKFPIVYKTSHSINCSQVDEICSFRNYFLY